MTTNEELAERAKEEIVAVVRELRERITALEAELENANETAVINEGWAKRFRDERDGLSEAMCMMEDEGVATFGDDDDAVRFCVSRIRRALSSLSQESKA